MLIGWSGGFHACAHHSAKFTSLIGGDYCAHQIAFVNLGAPLRIGSNPVVLYPNQHASRRQPCVTDMVSRDQ